MSETLTASPAELTADERAVVARASALARDVLAVNADRYDREALFPRDNFDALRGEGFLGAVIPTEYGGLGLRPVAYAAFLTELAKGCAATAGSFHMHNASMHFLNLLATDEQKQHFYAEALNEGALFGSWGAEPATSWSGPVALNTSYVAADDGYRVSGSKYFCSLGDGASYGFLYAVARDRASEANIEDVQFFVVSVDQVGVEIRDQWDPLGMRATVSKPVILEDAVVPEIGRVGRPGDITRISSEFYSLGYAAFYHGIAQAAYDWALDYARTRTVKPSNQPIGMFDRVQRKIGEMAIAVHDSRLAVEHAARVMSETWPQAAPESLGAALRAKATTTRVALGVTNLAIEVAGGPGVIRGTPTERYHRDARTAVLMIPAYDQCVETIAKNELGFTTKELT